MNKIIAFVMTLLMAYLCGAFIAASFNIADWYAELRFLCVFLGVPTALVAGVTVYGMESK